MNFLEKNLEDIIYETDNTILNERGLPIHGRKLRQYPLGGYGIADIITIQKSFYPATKKHKNHSYCFYFTVYELKKDFINSASLNQVVGYYKGIKELIKHLNISEVNNSMCFFNMVLIGKEMDTNSNFCYYSDAFHNLSFYTYDYKINGIYFNKQYGYGLVHSNFKKYRKHNV